jgi:hypothetical protein
MLRSVGPKIFWVGRATIFMVGLAVILAVVLGLASAALAGTGVGDVFNLGKKNTVGQLSQLVGRSDSAMLKVENDSAGRDATALNLQVEPGHTPMKVNSATRVSNLNADQLDGKDSSAFMPARTYTVDETIEMGSNVTGTTRVIFCDEGDVPIGGGFSGLGSQTQIKQSSRVFYTERPTWWVGATKPVGPEDTWTAQAVCADFGEMHT